MIIVDDKCLYHFCNLDAFQSIAKNKEFWLSETKTMNDATELQWFASNIKPIFVDYYEKQPSEFKKKYGDKFHTIMDHVYDEFFSENSYYHMFILCLSTKGDLLSQWRGYTPDGGNGISIGFNKEKLFELLKIQNASPPIIEIGDIDYDDKSKSKKFIQYIAESKLFAELDAIEEKDETNFVTRSIAVLERHFKIMFLNAALVKSDFFAEESEVRLYSWATLAFDGCNSPQGFSLSPIQYRSRGNMIIPYIKMNFSKCCDIANLIDEVVIGPKCQAPPSFISAILKSNGFVNAKVRKSDGFGIYR